MSERARMFMSSLPPERPERRLALAVVIVSAAIFAALAPFASLQLAPVWAFIPVYQSAIMVNDMVTAGLLLGQFAILRERAYLVGGTLRIETAPSADQPRPSDAAAPHDRA